MYAKVATDAHIDAPWLHKFHTNNFFRRNDPQLLPHFRHCTFKPLYMPIEKINTLFHISFSSALNIKFECFNKMFSRTNKIRPPTAPIERNDKSVPFTRKFAREWWNCAGIVADKESLKLGRTLLFSSVSRNIGGFFVEKFAQRAQKMVYKSCNGTYCWF